MELNTIIGSLTNETFQLQAVERDKGKKGKISKKRKRIKKKQSKKGKKKKDKDLTPDRTTEVSNIKKAVSKDDTIANAFIAVAL